MASQPPTPDAARDTTKVSRRFVLGLLGAAAAGAAGVATLLRLRGYPEPPYATGAPRAFGGLEYAALLAFGRRVVPPGATPDVAYVDAYVDELQPRSRRDVLRFIIYVEQIAPFTVGHASRFSRLEPEAQDEVLRALEESRLSDLRAGFEALRSMVLMAYYRQPASWPALGYGGPVVVWNEARGEGSTQREGTAPAAADAREAGG